MSIPRQIAYNVVVSSIAKVLSTAAALVSIGFITRYLGTNGFGMYTTALAYLSLFTALGDWGLNQICTREISCPNAKEKEIISNVAGLRMLVSLGILILIPLVVFFLPYDNQELKIGIIIVSCSFLFSSYYQVLNGLFQKRLIMNQVTLAELTGKMVQVLLVVVGVKMNLGFYFIALSLTASMLVNLIIVHLLARRFITFSLKFDVSYWKEFLRQSFPVGLGAIVTFIYFKADSILLSFFKSPQDVGLYGAAYKVIENISFFPAMIVGLTMPLFSFHIHSNREQFVKIFNKNFKVFLILVLPLIIGVMFLADGVIAIIAGQGYEPSGNVLRIIIFALGFIFFGTLFNNVLIAARKQKQLLIILAICAVFNIVVNVIFIPRYSYLSTSFASVATEMLEVILSVALIYKSLGVLPKINRFPLLLLSGFIMAAYLWLMREQNFFVQLISSPLLYFGMLIIFKVISKEEILSIISKKPQIE